MKLYDQAYIQNWYNEYANQETERWNKSPVEKVKHALHLHFLNLHITDGDKILELGAGTGKFTQELARGTSQLWVTDLSPVQLELNQAQAKEKGYWDKVEAWAIEDICDLSSYADASFDKLVCYGGPLSYVFEKKGIALKEMNRVLKPGGKLLLSVMNLWGTVHEYMDKIILEATEEENERVIKSGNLHPSSYAPSGHYCHMFTAKELQGDLEEAGFQLLTISATNCLAALRGESLEALMEDEKKWTYFMSLEIRACQSAGMTESGTHLIAVVQK